MGRTPPALRLPGRPTIRHSAVLSRLPTSDICSSRRNVPFSGREAGNDGLKLGLMERRIRVAERVKPFVIDVRYCVRMCKSRPGHSSRCLRHQGPWGKEEWTEISRRYRQRNQTCEECKEKASTQVDHKEPCWRRGNDDLANLQALCDNCHGKKNKAECAEFHAVHPRKLRPKLQRWHSYFIGRELHPLLHVHSQQRPTFLVPPQGSVPIGVKRKLH